MGFWSGIKHALNSTLGTSDFQSIDKMILGTKGLVESDNLYLNTGINESFTASLSSNQVIRREVSSTIKANWSGSIKLGFVAKTNQTSSNRTYVEVYKNDSNIYSYPVSQTTLNVPISSIVVAKGDIIKIAFLMQTESIADTVNFNVSVQDVKIFADLKDTSGISIL